MDVGQARAEAARWVARHAAGLDGYGGAFFSGSTVGRPGHLPLPPSSDVDVSVVLTGDTRPTGSAAMAGKTRSSGVLLDVSFLPHREVASAEQVLATYYLAGSFRHDAVVDDPTGHLRELHRGVSARFAEPAWVERRVAGARRRIVDHLSSRDASAPFHEQVTAWLFGTGVTTHVLLVAALRNPTVRRRYATVREVLLGAGLPHVHEELLDLLGCAELSAERVTRHCAALARTFDEAARVARTPFRFSGDLTPAARPVAIDGSLELAGRGLHREAMFWIVATFARCHAVLSADAPALHRAHEPAFREAVADLGIVAPSDIEERTRTVLARLPWLDAVARLLIADGDAPARRGGPACP